MKFLLLPLLLLSGAAQANEGTADRLIYSVMIYMDLDASESTACAKQVCKIARRTFTSDITDTTPGKCIFNKDIATVTVELDSRNADRVGSLRCVEKVEETVVSEGFPRVGRNN